MTSETISLAAALRTWRERLTPDRAGLPNAGGRRTPGLRREELAGLAGISVDYVVRLEQGRSNAPSEQVMLSLARALQLTDDEQEHLYRLARLPISTHEVSDSIAPGLQRALERLQDAAVAVFAADWRLIWWNTGWAGLLGDPSGEPAELRNFARDTFPIDDHGPRLSQWTVTTDNRDTVQAAVVSDLRRATGRFPESARLRDLIEDLCSHNTRFAELWASGRVGAHQEARKTVEHPDAGPVLVDCDVMTQGDAEQKVVMLTSAASQNASLRQALARKTAEYPVS